MEAIVTCSHGVQPGLGIRVWLHLEVRRVKSGTIARMLLVKCIHTQSYLSYMRGSTNASSSC